MQFETLAQTFWQHGFVMVEHFFDPVLMDQCMQAIETHYGLDPSIGLPKDFVDKSQTDVAGWSPLDEGVQRFEQLGQLDNLKQFTTAVLGKQWQDIACLVFYSKPGTKGQAWHQDCPPEDATKFNLNRLIYTHDVNETTGGQTVVVPGSHKHRKMLPPGDPQEEIADQIVLSPKKGTLVLLHGHCWHRVCPVAPSCHRVSTNFRMVLQHSPTDVTDVGVYRNMLYRFSTGQVLEERVV